MNHVSNQNLWAGLAAHYIRDLVYGANDGIITTFAVVAGVQGAGLSSFTIVALGFANLAADGMSMAVGNYLGIKSEEAVNNDEYRYWPASRHAAKHGAATWIAFSIAGLIPLLPYIAPFSPFGHRLWTSVVMTCFALFVVGALRTWVTLRSPIWSGLEMLLVGASAGAVAYLAGMGIASIANT